MRRTLTTATPFEFPQEVPCFPNQIALVRTKINCMYLYKRVPEYEDLTRECSYDIINRPYGRLWTAFRQGDGEAALEVALRLYTGCTVRRSVEGAIDVLHAIIDPQHPDAVHDPPRFLAARAFSFLILIHYDMHEEAHAGRPIEADGRLHPFRRYILPSNTPDIYLANVLLHRAAIYANETARYGFVTPYVLNVSQSLVRCGERDRIDVRNDPRYRDLAHMWRVHDIRRREMEQEQQKRDRKVARVPDAYVCAADGCGISAVKRLGLRACAGKCPPERKPRYCSKECQTKDWKRHKAYCKPDEELDEAVEEVPAPEPDQDGANAVGDHEDAAARGQPPPTRSGSHDGRARAVDINVPGDGSFSLQSAHITPAYLKWMRSEISSVRTELPVADGFLFRAGDIGRQVLGEYYDRA
ncbi:hypothetical protein OH76DRAFT_1029291 [Lentinus brumalis]|uniref:MYND-type domain-containing protein n=1 Tax=Lentinus brumalis TaxID=2498619 RepID=A0A371CXC8_9APHY|nr:hypothetical protein OH76DRAFT_1029291 [Polyporus brumalis]